MVDMTCKDKGGFSTTITPLGNGQYGVRVLRNGVVISEDNSSCDRREAALKLKELLRWVDKLGYDSPMASASRVRNYCKKQDPRR